MDSKDIYGVQTFIRDRKGTLAQGRFIECRDADHARQTAEARVSGAAAVGAAAFLRPGYKAEFDGGDEPITLAIFGTVPPGVEDTIPF